MKPSTVMSPIEDWAAKKNVKCSNVMIAEESGVERRRVAQIKKHPNVMTVGELEALGRAFGFRLMIVREG